MEFRIAGKGPSRRISGNRIIVIFDKVEITAKILLVYHKEDLPRGGNETYQWKNMIREHYPEYSNLL